MCLLNDIMEKEEIPVKAEPMDHNNHHQSDKSQHMDNKDEHITDTHQSIDSKDELIEESRRRPLLTGPSVQTNPKKKRRPAVLCVECPICKGPAPDHLHFGGQCCYSCRAFFRRTSHKCASSFRCRGGKNNCKIISGTKSCIPCRLNKCLQVGMDPSQVRGKKCKEDLSTSGDDDSQYILSSPEPSTSSSLADSRFLLYSPPVCPDLSKTCTSQESEAVLRFKAGIMKYQGMCLQYQASLLEEQAGTVSIVQGNGTPSCKSEAATEKSSTMCLQEEISKTDERHFFNDMRQDFEINGFSAETTTEDIKVPFANTAPYRIIQYNPSCYLEKRVSPGKIVENPNYSAVIPPRSTPSPLDLRSKGSKILCPIPTATGHEQMQSMPRIFFKTSVSCQSTSVSCQDNQPSSSFSCQNNQRISNVSCLNNQPISGLSSNQPNSGVSCQNNSELISIRSNFEAPIDFP